ncbi:MAG: hypothetical protein M0P73_08250 [Syntrophobacterales bacterium]|jgi:hypothetical protein|nr:hypothetical protein [Syntrophobacterales bacterium]
MKKVLAVLTIATLVAFAVPAFADDCCPPPPPSLDGHCDVSLDGQVTFTKDVTITQTRTDNYTTRINKLFDPKARADAEAVKNDLNNGNDMWVSNSTFDDTMTGSFQFFQGIGQSNQAASNMNNQGNIVAVAYAGAQDVYSSSLAASGVSNSGNFYGGGYSYPCSDLDQTDTMTGSFQYFQGIGQSNQSAGSMNNQNNVVSVAAGVDDNGSGGYFCGWGGKGSMVAMAGSELAMNNTNNTFCLSKADFSTNMSSSFIAFQGIGQSNQSAGNMNNQCNVVSVAAAVSLGQ